MNFEGGPKPKTPESSAEQQTILEKVESAKNRRDLAEQMRKLVTDYPELRDPNTDITFTTHRVADAIESPGMDEYSLRDEVPGYIIDAMRDRDWFASMKQAA